MRVRIDSIIFHKTEVTETFEEDTLNSAKAAPFPAISSQFEVDS